MLSKQAATHRVVLTCGGVLLLVATLCAASVALLGANTTASITRWLPSSPAARYPQIGTPVVDGDLEFTVAAMECAVPAVGEGSGVQVARGQFCVVSLTVRNVGSDPHVVSDSNMTGHAGNADYRPDGAADLALGDTLWLSVVPSGESAAGKVAFDLPVGVKLDRVTLRESAVSPGITIATR